MASRIICLLCNKKFGPIKIHSHYPSCIMTKYNNNSGYLISFMSCGITSKLYFMHCVFPVGATLKTIDVFLRKIWCNCCKHVSMFFNKGHNYSKKTLIKDCPINTKLMYEYDMCSPTRITIIFHGFLPGLNPINDTLIVIRNPAITHTCTQCLKPATKWLNRETLCDKCSEKDDVEQEFLLPIVDSPRTGECGCE